MLNQVKHYTIRQFAEAYGMSMSTAYAQIRKGRLRTTLIDGSRLLTSRDIESWFRSDGNRVRLWRINEPYRQPVVISNSRDLMLFLMCDRGRCFTSVADRVRIQSLLERGVALEIERRSDYEIFCWLAADYKLEAGGSVLYCMTSDRGKPWSHH